MINRFRIFLSYITIFKASPEKGKQKHWKLQSITWIYKPKNILNSIQNLSNMIKLTLKRDKSVLLSFYFPFHVYSRQLMKVRRFECLADRIRVFSISIDLMYSEFLASWRMLCIWLCSEKSNVSRQDSNSVILLTFASKSRTLLLGCTARLLNYLDFHFFLSTWNLDCKRVRQMDGNKAWRRSCKKRKNLIQ